MNTFLAGGIVLCGGKSSRMGRPKAWLPFGPEVLLQRIVRILDAVVGPLVVVAAPDQELPDLPDHVLVTRDELPGRGPLEGLSAGLHALPESTTVAYLSACDVPFLNYPFINKLISDLGDADIAVPFADGHYHPLAAVYRTSIISQVDRLLNQDRLRPFFLFDKVNTIRISETQLRKVDPELDCLQNLNQLSDYHLALEKFHSLTDPG